MCGWLGGFCGDANENSLCQDLFIDGGTLNWFWMGHVSDPGDMVYISIDGVEVWQHILELADHTYGIWQNTEGTLGGADVAAFCGGTHNVCLGFHLLNLGSNMLVDYVTLDGACGTANAEVNFSSVKALY